MSKTNPAGVPVSHNFDELTPPPHDIPVWTSSHMSKFHERLSDVEIKQAAHDEKHRGHESSHVAVKQEVADIKLANNEQQKSLSKIELGMVGIQTTMAHISSEMARSNQRADAGGQNVANWIRFSIQIILTIAAVLVAVYAASKK